MIAAKSEQEEEVFLAEWRRYGPLGILIEILNAINTPQLYEYLDRLQYEENEVYRLPDFKSLSLIKPVKTRWNSYHSAFERAVQLRGPIDTITEHLVESWNAENAPTKKRRTKIKEKKTPPRYVSEGGLNGYDWHVITKYVEILQPLKDATKLLEARGSSGKHGSISEVLPTFEWLLHHFEELKSRLKDATLQNYPDQEHMEDHFEINVTAGWRKLQKYYAKLDETPVYYASVLLHPQWKDLLIQAWKDKPDWLRKNNAAFQRLWKEYCDICPSEITQGSMSQSNESVRIQSGRDEFLASFTTKNNSPDDEYSQWNQCFTPLSKDHPLAKDPIKYWWQERNTRPKLARFALDILSIPATSCDCERAFSELGDLLEPRRAKMKPDIIAALQCCKDYRRLGFERNQKGESR